MANALQLGSKLIPIIQHFDLTGTTPTATPTLPITETTADRFGLGTSVAFAHYPLSTSSESPTQEAYISDTELVLHDNTFIQFDLQEDSMVYPTATLILSASHNGSPVSLTPGLVNMLLYPGRNSMSSSVAETFETNFVAYSFAWPDATDPAYQRKGYLIYKVRRITNTYPAGNFNVQFDEQSLWVNCPYYNKNNNWDTYIEETPVPDPDDPPFDPTIPDDYNPHIDDTSDLISIPSSPTIGVSNAGWVHVYSPSTGTLVNFGEWLFPNPELPSSADPTEIVNYLLLLCQTISNSRLIDYILDCHIIPVSPTTSASQDIQVGGRTATGITAPIVASDYIDVSCGSLNIQEYFAGFQDYLYTKSKLYLPFVGFVDMIPEYWQSGVISVDYKFNVIDGSFMCYIRSNSSMMEYLKITDNGQKKTEGTTVNLSALSVQGTIMLPIAKTPNQKRLLKKKRQARTKLVSSARNGDENAIESLTLDDMNIYTTISDKILKEDVYTLVDNYFMPYGVECDQYAIMGEITDYRLTINTYTKEPVYILSVTCSDVEYDIAINRKDLVGEPAVGRRFKGNIWLQGHINFRK